MQFAAETSRLWNLVQGGQQIDPEDLFDAVIEETRGDDALDVRTRMLIKEALETLGQKWGSHVVRNRVVALPAHSRLSTILAEEFEKQGFPSLEHRVMDTTKSESILQFLRELGSGLTQPVSVDIGGSTALILKQLLSRRTEDIDVVDEVPEAIRSDHALLRRLLDRYDLRLAHFQSHYLPEGWKKRTHALDRFGNLEIRLVDSLDIFIGKLFSKREKDLDDLRALAPQFERAKIEERLRGSAQRMLADPALRTNAERNWWIVFGEKLPG